VPFELERKLASTRSLNIWKGSLAPSFSAEVKIFEILGPFHVISRREQALQSVKVCALEAEQRQLLVSDLCLLVRFQSAEQHYGCHFQAAQLRGILCVCVCV
jgi:hypothetical protein